MLALNTTSPAIITGSGIHIFTPILKTIPVGTTDKETLDKSGIAANNSSANMFTRNLLKAMNEKSKIIKNLKTD